MIKDNQQPALVVDLGGTKIITAVVLPSGKVVSRNYCLTLAAKGPEAVTNRLLTAASKTVAQAKLETTELSGVGIAVAGVLDAKRGIITHSPNLPGWNNIPLRDILAEKFGIDTYIVNDASAAALGEHRFGAGKGVANLVYLTVSTGIGGGIIIDNKLYLGTDGCAGELGHMTIEAQGPQCSCGNLGCLESLASGTAVAREAVKCLGQGEASSIAGLVEGKLESVTADIVALAASQNDPLACNIVARAANYLGIGLANMVNIFNPELIVIGGGMSQMGDMLLEPARKVIKERAFRMPAQTVRVVRASLGSNSGIIGAATCVFEQ